MKFGDEISVMSEGKCIMSMLLSFLTFFFFLRKEKYVCNNSNTASLLTRIAPKITSILIQ